MMFPPESTTWLLAGAAGSCAAAVAYVTCSPRCGLLVPVHAHGSRDDPPRIALTFDDGPDPAHTPRLLDLLAAEGVPAAFFAIGRHVERHPALVARTHAEGHILGNHSHKHDYHGPFRFRAYWRRELERADDAIASVIGARPRLMRPPMGIRNPHLARLLRESDRVAVTWTHRALDGLPTTARRILARLAPRVRGGDIIALHDGADGHFNRSHDQTLAAVADLIPALRARGIAFARLDDLIGEPPYG